MDDKMKMMVPFRYVEFYDVPRVIVFTVDGATYLLDSPFVKKQDDYSSSYQVYQMPDGFADSEWGSDPLAKAVSRLGEVPVNSMVFDETKRRLIDVSTVRHLLRRES
jgi:hypothetical protein